MPTHQYNPREALELLMTKLRSRDEELAAEIQAAIDAGKDVAETEPIPGRRKRHVYRRTTPFSNEEALQVAVTGLRAYFVEQPMFVAATAAEFAQAAIGKPFGRQTFSPITPEKHEAVSLDSQGEEKRIEIEIQTETQISREGEETLRLVQVPTGTIEEQRQHINRLAKLVDFRER